MTCKDADNETDDTDSRAVSEYHGELRESSGNRLILFNVTSVLVLLIWLIASLHGAGCLGK